jgi:dTDP-glucose 4,6-dehydratase
MKILVTGGAGFIGSHYVRTVLQGGYPGYGHADVTVLDKLTPAGNLASLEPVAASPRFSFVRGDTGDAALLASVVPGHDVVVNFAVHTRADRPGTGAPGSSGVQALLQACLDAKVARVVQVSTDAVYGSVDSGSLAEGAPLEPSSPHAAATAGGDLLALAYARRHGLDVSITRCCNNYGPYQDPGKVIPLFVTNLLEGLKLPLHGDGDNVRGWVHVDDHCHGIQAVLEKGQPGRVYHIAGDAELSNRELTQAVLDCFGADWDMVAYVDERQGDDRRHSLDDSALREIGYAPRIPFSDGLKATVRWYQENRHWWEPLKEPWPGTADAEPAGGTSRSGEELGPAAAHATPPRRRGGFRRRKSGAF